MKIKDIYTKYPFDINAIGEVESEAKMLFVCYHSQVMYGKVFLPGDFKRSESPAVHYEICAEINNRTSMPFALIIARDHAKTTLIKSFILKTFCYTRDNMYKFSKATKNPILRAYWEQEAKEWEPHFFGWVSSTQKKSFSNVKYVSQHLDINLKIRHYFGDLNGKRQKGYTWAKEEIVTATEDKLLSRSNLSSLRGETHPTTDWGALRYTGVFIDDAENEDNTKTENARDGIASMIMDGVYPAIDKKRGRLFFIATPVHYDSFAQRLMDDWAEVQSGHLKDFMWRMIVKPATQPLLPGGVLWPDRYPKEELEKIRKTYVHSPKGEAGYWQEYELQVQSEEDALWTDKHIEVYKGSYIYIDGTSYIVINDEYVPVLTFLGCDPATDIDTKSSDYSVIMVIGVDSANNRYCIDYERHRSIPTLGRKVWNVEQKKFITEGKKGVVDYIIEMYQRYHCEHGVVEDVAMTRSVHQDLWKEQRRLNIQNMTIIPEKPAGRDKHNKIYTYLNQWFAMGAVHILKNHTSLRYEIKTFGEKMGHDDTIETFYFCCMYARPPKTATQGAMGTSRRVLKKEKPRAKHWFYN